MGSVVSGVPATVESRAQGWAQAAGSGWTSLGCFRCRSGSSKLRAKTTETHPYGQFPHPLSQHATYAVQRNNG